MTRVTIMQYFIGIPLPDDIKKRVVSFQKSFKNNEVPFMVEPHITVKTQGGLSEDKTWIPIIETAAKNCPVFEISFSDVGSFGDKVLFLNPSSQKEFINLHKILINIISPSEDLIKKYFEGNEYHAHLTLAGTAWGMTDKEMSIAKEKAKLELLNLPKFMASLVRIYEQKDLDGAYEKILDIPLKN